MSKRTGIFALILACLLLASCRSAGPVKTFVKGDEVEYYDFTAAKQFEQGTYDSASLLVRDGVYRIDIRSGDDELWWGQGGPTLRDVVIDVDAAQMSERNENAFGIMCRVRGHVGQQNPASAASPSATAEATSAASAVAQVTAALTAEATSSATSAASASATSEATASANVAAQGLAQMMAGATAQSTAEATAAATTSASAAAESTTALANPLAQELADVPEDATAQATAEATLPPVVIEDNNGDGYLFLVQGTGSFAIFRARGRSLTPLVNWTTSDKIKVGPDRNHLRAVCVGTYLAFYANDAFLGDATDDTYSEGQVGLAASAANRLGVRIDYDNLSVANATPG